MDHAANTVAYTAAILLAEIFYRNSTLLLHLTIQRVLLHYSILKKTRGGIR